LIFHHFVSTSRSKKTIMLNSRFAFAVVVTAIAAQANAATFVWDAKKVDYDKRIPKVTLSNDVLIEEVKGQTLFEQSVTAKPVESKQKLELVKNDLVRIEAAFPTARKAAVVLISDDCSGSACGSPTLTVMVPRAGSVKHYRVDNPSKVTLVVEGDRVIGGAAEGIPVGFDKYGSQVTTTRNFEPGLGFVATGFKKEFAKLVGEHPDQFFEDKALREPFAKVVGFERFRDLRAAIGVASATYLVQGRYIVLQGCMPHNCGGNYSFVMIDAVTSKYFWARFKDGATSYAGASDKVDKAALESVFTDAEFVQQDDARLTVTPAGKIVYRTNSR
jgi:hypothetical protein